MPPARLRDRLKWLGLALALAAGLTLLQQTLLLAPPARAAARPAPPDNGPPVTPTLYLPAIFNPTPRLLIAAAHIDSALSGEGDEAILLQNVGQFSAQLAGWQLRGNGRTASFPATSTLALAPGGQLWCAKDASVFRQTFGFAPACEWASGDPSVPDLLGSAPSLTNAGGTLALLTPQGDSADVLAYGDESATPPGWQGAPAQLYSRGEIPVAGQVWRRKIDPQTGQPQDTDRATDWAGDLADLSRGRQVYFPGWAVWGDPLPALTALSTAPVSATATITAAVGPDGLYPPLAGLIDRADRAIDISLYTLEHPELARKLADAARRGVAVRLLLEGAPSGGIDDLQKWSLWQIQQAGGQVFYLAPRADAPKGLRPRYRFLHTKFALFDGRWAAVGTENFTRSSMPVDTDTGQMPPGRRGLYLLTDALPVVSALAALFAYDWQPQRFADLRPFDPATDGPPPGYQPPLPGQPGQPAPFRQPLATTGPARFAVVYAPGAAASAQSQLLALLAEAGPGDAVDWVQLYEHRNWGESFSNPVADPNPRLEALVAAARQGAHVRLLLDNFFDDPAALRSNRATADYLQALAQAEGLLLEVRLGNPTGAGIHAKAGLIRLDGAGWAAVGSLNGGEVSHKLNREVLLLVQSRPIYDRLRQVFESDWAASPP